LRQNKYPKIILFNFGFYLFATDLFSSPCLNGANTEDNPNSQANANKNVNFEEVG
jgi:hypothetical protein